MRIMAINGSPRKNWNTATLLTHVLDGAKEAAGADTETELVHLYTHKYTGCISCFACKRIGAKSYGRCVVKDGIEDILDRARNADALIFGSPIYFGDVTGMFRAFMERLLFATFVYDQDYSTIAPKRMPTAFVYTMNVTDETMHQWNYPERLGLLESYAGRMFMKPHILYANNTYQFDDYGKYVSSAFSEPDKRAYKEQQFPEDCRKAHNLGRELVAQGSK